MRKIGLIIAREYLSRVKKKSFIVMTFLGPILIGLMYGVAIWLAINADEMNTKKQVKVVDESKLFEGSIRNSSSLEFEFVNTDIETLKERHQNDKDLIWLLPDNSKFVEIDRLEKEKYKKIQDALNEILPDLPHNYYKTNAIEFKR